MHAYIELMMVKLFSSGEEMDGEALFDAFGYQSGPDCLKDVVPKYGQRVKVYKAIKVAMNASLTQEVVHHTMGIVKSQY